MIIPIGHESAEVRRTPWITIAIIASCTVVLIATSSGQEEREAQVVAARDQLQGYFTEHPYLDLDPRAARWMLERFDEREWEATIETLVDLSAEPFEWELEEQQQQLDALTQRFLSLIEGHPFYRYGLSPSRPRSVGWLTHMFMHAGWLHLAGNMLLLFIVGACIEDVWGRPIYTGFYLSAGLFAAGFYVAQHAGNEIALVGASGAVSGVMGAFLVRYWSRRLRFFYWFLFVLRGTFVAPAWLVLPLWFGNEFFSAWVLDQTHSGGDGVAHWAHVGGFVYGVAIALALRALKLEERVIDSAIEAKVTFVSNPLLDRALSAISKHEYQQAFDLLAPEVNANRARYELCIAYWDAAKHLDRCIDASPALAGVLRQDVQRGNLELALAHVDELDRQAPGTPIDARVLAKLGSLLLEAGQQARAAAVMRRAVDEGAGTLPTQVAVRLARLTREVDPEMAARAAQIALSAPDLDPLDRRAIEPLLAEARAETLQPPPEAQVEPESEPASVSGVAKVDSELFDTGCVDLGEAEEGRAEVWQLEGEGPVSFSELDSVLRETDETAEGETSKKEGDFSTPFELASTFDFGEVDDGEEGSAGFLGDIAPDDKED